MNTSNFGVLGSLPVPLAFGLLRLSTAGRPEEADALRVLHRALDGGIRVLDTADSYCLDEPDRHYGERLLQKAMATWSGDPNPVRIITKVGLTRPQGRWVPNGRPEALRKAVEGSVEALGGKKLFMLLLHAKDPKVPFSKSLEALARMQQEGLVEHLGLCNVGVPEIRQAQGVFRVEALQVELSVMDRKASTSGVANLAAQLGIPFLAHRPLGGHADVEKLLKNRAMKPLAQKHKITPHQAALATLLDLPVPVVPLFGATKVESIEATLQALQVRLDDEDRAGRQKITFDPTPEALAMIEDRPMPPLRPLSPGDPPGADPEVVIVMGIQGAGKSTRVGAYVDAGYERLNRDLIGGKLEDLIPALDRLLSSGKRRVVLDNTYASFVSRWPVLRTAHRHGVPVRCVHLATPIQEALVNVTSRMLERYGKILSPEELKEHGKTDPNLPPPAAMAAYAASFEAPTVAEGFGVIETVSFERKVLPEHTELGLLLDVDGTIRTTISGAIYPSDPNDLQLLPRRKEVLEGWLAKGYRLFFVSNQSAIDSGKVSDEAVRACFDRTVQLLGLPVTEVKYCPHSAFPVSCFCRKPMPGMGVELIHKYHLARSKLVMVGDMDTDAEFAETIGAQFHWAKDFFGES